MMPCGCWALPLEIMHVLGNDISSFLCDKHGEVKVTKAWLKGAKDKVSAVRYEQVPSEFGYQVRITEGGL